MPGKNDKPVVIKKFDDRSEAELAKDYLESCDIDAFIQEDESRAKKTGRGRNLEPANLLVDPEDAEEAKKLLEEAEEDAPEFDYDDDKDDDEDDDDDDDYDEDEDFDDDDDDYYEEEEDDDRY